MTQFKESDTVKRTNSGSWKGICEGDTATVIGITDTGLVLQRADGTLSCGHSTPNYTLVIPAPHKQRADLEKAIELCWKHGLGVEYGYEEVVPNNTKNRRCTQKLLRTCLDKLFPNPKQAKIDELEAQAKKLAKDIAQLKEDICFQN